MPIAIMGTLLGSASGLCYGIYLFTSRKSGTTNPGRYVQPLMWAFLAQLVPQLIVMFFVSGRGFDITNGVLINGNLPVRPETMVGDPITLANWLWIIALAVIGQAMAWAFVQIGLVNMHPTTVAGLLLLSPVITVIAAGFTHGETASMLQVIGIIVVLVAVAVQNELHVPLLVRLKREQEEEEDEQGVV